MSTSIIRINLVIITIGAYQNGTLFTLWHKIFAGSNFCDFSSTHFSRKKFLHSKYFST